MKKALFFCLFILIGLTCFAEDKIPAGWEKADIKWSKFAKEHLDRMRQHELTLPLAKSPKYKFDMRWEDLKGPLITKYLGDYKVFFDTRWTFVLDKTGHIICFSTFLPLDRPFESAPDLELTTYSQFLKKLRIKIRNAEDAVEMAKLWRAVPDRAKKYEEPDFKYRASKINNSWIVEKYYVGPPANCYSTQPSWKITPNKEGYLEQIDIIHIDPLEQTYEYSKKDIPAAFFFPKNKARWDGNLILVADWLRLDVVQKSKFISEYLEELKKEYNQNIEVDIPKYIRWLNSFANEKKETEPFYEMTMAFKTYLFVDRRIPFLKGVANITGITIPGPLPEYYKGFEEGYSGLPKSESGQDYIRGYEDGKRDHLNRLPEKKIRFGN